MAYDALFILIYLFDYYGIFPISLALSLSHPHLPRYIVYLLINQ